MAFPISLLNPQKSGGHSYDPVPALEEETAQTARERSDAHIQHPSHRHLFRDPSFWLTALAVLSIAFTAQNLLLIQIQQQESPVTILEAPLGSPYNGLEKLARNESSPLWPLSSTHYPGFLGAMDGTRIQWKLYNGSLVQLDTDHSVVLQHRVRDFGLENCAVALLLPDADPETREGYTSMGDDLYLSLWRLDEVKTMISTSQLPYDLTSRKEFLGDISLDGVNPPRSRFFQCSAQSVQTLEITISCTSTPCSLQFDQTKPPESRGVRIIQSEMLQEEV